MKLGTIEDLARCATADSPYARAAEAAGFVLHEVCAVHNPDDFGYLVSMDFTCVCGKRERVMHAFPDDRDLRYAPREFYDIARILYKIGSFSRSHLLKDGYTPEQVEEIVSKYEASLRGEEQGRREVSDVGPGDAGHGDDGVLQGIVQQPG